MADETSVGSIKYDLDLDDSKFKGKAKDATKDINNINTSFQEAEKGSKIFAAGLAIVGTAIIGFGISSLNAFNESAKGLAQLDAVLESTKGVAGVTRDEVIKLGAALQQQTSISDEAVISSENMLLTFTNIGKKIFPDTTKAVADMATAMNGGLIPSAEDLRTKAILLGKALQDPDAGLGALHRVGVNVDELKKKFTDSMTVQEKQILILKELNTEFGGSAYAAGHTFAGQIQLAKENFNDFQELIGKAIKDRLEPLVAAFNKWTASMGGAEGMMKKLNEILTETLKYLPAIVGAIIGGLIPSLIDLGGALWTNVIIPLIALSPWVAIGAAIGVIVMMLINHFGGWDIVVRRLADAFVFVQGKLQPFIDFAETKFTRLGQILQGFGISGQFGGLIIFFTDMQSKAEFAFERVGQLIEVFKTKLAGFGEGQKASWIDAFEGVMTRLKPIFDALQPSFEAMKESLFLSGQIIQTQLLPAWNALVEVFKPLLAIIGPQVKQLLLELVVALVGLAVVILTLVVGAISGFVTAVANSLPYVIQAFEGLTQFFRGFIQIIDGILHNDIGMILEGFKQMFVGAAEFVENVFTAFGKFIWGFIKGVISYFQTLYDKLVGHSIIPDLINDIGMWFNKLPGMISGALSNIYNIITTPFKNAFDQVTKWANDALQKVKDALDFTKRHSPSVLDIVKTGVGLVTDELMSIGQLTMPTFSSVLVDKLNTAGVTNTNQDINIHIDQVGGMQDVNALGRELGFRAGIQPK